MSDVQRRARWIAPLPVVAQFAWTRRGPGLAPRDARDSEVLRSELGGSRLAATETMTKPLSFALALTTLLIACSEPSEGSPDDGASASAAALAGNASDFGGARTLAAGESIAVVSTCKLPMAPAPSAIRVTENVVYASPKGAPQRLDVVVPTAPGPHPLVVLVHGGGWTTGDKSGMRRLAESLASVGFVAAAVNYRLAKDDGSNAFPAPVSDVRCAVRWLRANAGSYGIDSARVASVGASAGAHLSAMLGVGARVSELDDGTCPAPLAAQPVSVRAVAGFYTPTDFRDASVWLANDNAGAGVINLLGGPIDADPALAALASPITHVSARSAPFFLAHGTADATVPVAQSDTFEAALHGAGAKATLVKLEGAEHAFPVLSPQYPVTSCTLLAFLNKYLAP